jgi:lipopolysaccharide assembly outer membrane protein LptD (OstA)
MVRSKNRLFLGLSATLIIGFLLIVNYKGSSIKLRPSLKTSSMEHMLLTHKQDNEVKWELYFPPGNKKIFLKSLGLKVKRSPEIYLTSQKGVYEVEKGNITLDNTVELNIRDTKLATNSLEWNSKNELITTKDDVKFSGKNFLIEGAGLIAKTKKQQVRIVKNVKAIFYR